MATVRNSSIKIEDEREPRGPTINQMLHVPILMLKFIGVYIEGFSLSRTTVRKVFSNCLVMIMGLLVMARLIAGFVSDSDFSSKLTGRLTFAIAYISNIVMFPVFVVNSSRNLHRVLVRFSTYQSKHCLAIDAWKTKRRTNEACAVFVIIGVVYLVSVVASVGLRIFPESGLFASRLLPFGYKDGHVFDLVSLQDTVTIAIFMFIVNLEIAIACVLSYIIIREFQSVNREADIYVRQSNVSASEIGKLRCRHFKVTQLLQAANCLIQPIVLLLYIIMLPSICLTVYGIVHSTLGLLDMIMLIQLLIAYIFGVTLLTGIGAMMNSEAHGVVQSLFELSLHDLSADGQYQVFISQVTGQNIGISIYGMFTMDGPTFLMIFGTIATYTVVVLQTQTGNCNVTQIFGTIATYTVVVLQTQTGNCNVTQVLSCNCTS